MKLIWNENRNESLNGEPFDDGSLDGHGGHGLDGCGSNPFALVHDDPKKDFCSAMVRSLDVYRTWGR